MALETEFCFTKIGNHRESVRFLGVFSAGDFLKGCKGLVHLTYSQNSS